MASAEVVFVPLAEKDNLRRHGDIHQNTETENIFT